MKVGARAPASAPAFSGVALRLALRVNFRSCAPAALRLLGAPLRSAVPRSAALQYSGNWQLQSKVGRNLSDHWSTDSNAQDKIRKGSGCSDKDWDVVVIYEKSTYPAYKDSTMPRLNGT